VRDKRQTRKRNANQEGGTGNRENNLRSKNQKSQLARGKSSKRKPNNSNLTLAKTTVFVK